jgi:hypothetical protein
MEAPLLMVCFEENKFGGCKILHFDVHQHTKSASCQTALGSLGRGTPNSLIDNY